MFRPRLIVRSQNARQTLDARHNNRPVKCHACTAQPDPRVLWHIPLQLIGAITVGAISRQAHVPSITPMVDAPIHVSTPSRVRKSGCPSFHPSFIFSHFLFLAQLPSSVLQKLPTRRILSKIYRLVIALPGVICTSILLQQTGIGCVKWLKRF